MSYMKELAIDCAELYLKRHPEADWDEAMEFVTSGTKEAMEIEREALNNRKH